MSPTDDGRRAVILATLAGTGHFLATNMIQPLVALYATALGVSPAAVGLILSSFGLLPMFLSVPAGLLVDRVDPRLVTKLGAVFSAGAAALMALTGHFAVLLLAETLLGSAHVITLVALQKYTATVSRPESRDANFAYLGSGTAAGMTLAPALGGAVVAAAGPLLGSDLLGYRTAFGLAALTALSPLVMALFMPPAVASSGARRGRPAAAGSSFAILRRPGMQLVTLGTFVFVGVLAMRLSFYPLLLAGAGYTAATVGLLFTVRSAATLAIRPFAGVLVRFIPREYIFTGSIVVMGLTWAVAPWNTSWTLQLINMAADGMASGLLYPLTLVLVTASCAEEERGLGMGLRFTVNRLAVVVTPALLGLMVARAGLIPAMKLSAIPVMIAVATAAILSHTAFAVIARARQQRHRAW